MSKRAPQEFEDGHEAYLKRQKLSHGGAPAGVVQEDIQSARQLQTLLAFQQDDAASKHGMWGLDSLGHAQKSVFIL